MALTTQELSFTETEMRVNAKETHPHRVWIFPILSAFPNIGIPLCTTCMHTWWIFHLEVAFVDPTN